MDEMMVNKLGGNIVALGLAGGESNEPFQIAGTAFIIGHNYVMTAAHLLDSCMNHKRSNPNKHLKIGLFSLKVDSSKVKFDFIEIDEIKEIILWSEQDLSAYPGPTNLDIALGIVEHGLGGSLSIKKPGRMRVNEEVVM
jgi:hypothetical protein